VDGARAVGVGAGALAAAERAERREWMSGVAGHVGVFHSADRSVCVSMVFLARLDADRALDLRAAVGEVLERDRRYAGRVEHAQRVRTDGLEGD
jgi:hypothetical protein